MKIQISFCCSNNVVLCIEVLFWSVQAFLIFKAIFQQHDITFAKK